MDTDCAKIVTDLDGRDHILIEGRLMSLVGPTTEVNWAVDAIVRGLRGPRNYEVCGSQDTVIPNIAHTTEVL